MIWGMKKCSACHASKPVDQFNKDRSKKDGLNPRCRECDRQRAQRDYQRHKQARLSKGRRWSAKNAEKHRDLQRQWAKDNPARVRAAQERHRRKQGAKPRAEFAQRIEDARRAASENGCWIWEGPVDREGYGRWARALAHRESFRRYIGPIPPNRHLHHLCGEPRCVNPDHLQVVTAAEHRRLHLKE